MPVASDMPMVNTVMIEVPNPAHPYGLRGLGEVSLTPALTAVANAVKNALGFRVNDLPLNPPRILAAIEEYEAR